MTYHQNILVVDDQEANRVAMEAILEELDYSVIYAASGEEALSVLLKEKISLVLLDVQMPDMDGFEVAEIMRSHPRSKDIPIIFVTAINKGKAFVFKGYELGAVDYLFKPIDAPVLLSKVSFFMELAEKTQKLQSALTRNQLLIDYNDILLQAIGDGVLGVNAKGDITFANPAAMHLLAAEADVLIGKNVESYFCINEDGEEDVHWGESRLLAECLAGNAVQTDDNFVIKKPNGPYNTPIGVTISPMGKADDQFRGAVLLFHDISERKAHEAELTQRAEYDELTGVANRSLFYRLAEQAWSKCERQNEGFAVLFIDLDGFKQVNDTLGHSIGDGLLKQVALRLRMNLRKSDILCRMGGDEFVILLDGIEHAGIAAKISSKLISQLTKTFDIDGQQVSIGGSIGVAIYPDDAAANIFDLLNYADSAMYEAKSKGKSQAVFYNKGLFDSSPVVDDGVMSVFCAMKYQWLTNVEQAGAGILQLHITQVKASSVPQADGIAASVNEAGELGIEFTAFDSEAKLINDIAAHCSEYEERTLAEFESEDPSLGGQSRPVKQVVLAFTELDAGLITVSDIFEFLKMVKSHQQLAVYELILQCPESVLVGDIDSVSALLTSLDMGLAITDAGGSHKSFEVLAEHMVRYIVINSELLNTADQQSVGAFAAIISTAHGMGLEVISSGQIEVDLALSLGIDYLCINDFDLICHTSRHMSDDCVSGLSGSAGNHL